MKRTFLVLMCAALIMLLFAGCKRECEHEYTETVTKKATYEQEGEMTYTCSKCNQSYIEVIAKLERPIVPTSVLDTTVSNMKYSTGPFTTTLGKLVKSAISNYSLKHYTYKEAIAEGYLQKSQFNSSIDTNFVYCTVISGDTQINPSIPYLTEYEAQAVVAWMLFDENNQLQQYGYKVCENLNTYAIILMSSSY